mgnify:CR=1 FL=1
MTEAGWTVCIECGMMCEAVEYHPYAACLMFKQCLNSETVRANLQAVRDDSYHQGRVDSLEQKVEELEMEIKRRVWLSHGSRMKHLLYGDDGKMDCNSCGRDYAAMPLEVAQRYELDDAIKLAQQAQEGGVGDEYKSKG